MKQIDFNKLSTKDKLSYIKDLIEGYDGRNGLRSDLHQMKELVKTYKRDRLFLSVVASIIGVVVGWFMFLLKIGVLSVNV